VSHQSYTSSLVRNLTPGSSVVLTKQAVWCVHKGDCTQYKQVITQYTHTRMNILYPMDTGLGSQDEKTHILVMRVCVCVCVCPSGDRGDRWIVVSARLFVNLILLASQSNCRTVNSSSVIAPHEHKAPAKTSGRLTVDAIPHNQTDWSGTVKYCSCLEPGRTGFHR
jgi:hypothetical protein